ncbi:protease complex subunit PrcB family protein [Marinobacter sp. BW6]|uniref:protease complex subunit PrcB family protein n=1 Tax=Marinobacter sp. BW6 TaxID=2592624 RepID=UPI0011DEF42A|nr:protease complex subunit PrcB family protein [Marinobacter sp. BW6]TYC57908.1 protease complex subunit PrcB family protein [Marinobacter sp. BW6]
MPIHARVCCLLVAMFLASGCASSRSETEEGGPLARQITQSAHCGLTAPGQVHLTSREEVQRLEALPGRNLSLESLKNIDFEREHLVLAAIGQKPTGGFGVTLDSSEIRSGTLELRVRVTEPAPGTIVTQALTTPCAVIAVTAEGWDGIQITRAENNR